MQQKTADTGRLASLDGLRGLAAIAVVLLHGNEIFVLPWVPKNAYLAVDFFFLLSGYVLARSFDQRLRGGWAFTFLKRRLIRLYPLIAAGSVIGFVVLLSRSLIAHALTIPMAGLDFVSSLLLIPTPPVLSPTWQFYPDDPPLWSLFYELAANLLYAFLCPLLTGRRLAALIGVSGLALAIAIITHHNADFALDHFELGGLRVMFSFFLGVGFHRLMVSETWRTRVKPKRPWPAAVGLFSFAVLAVLLFSPAPLGATYALAGIFVVFPLLLWLTLSCGNFGPRAERLCLWLGLLSYPLYATHQPFFRLISGMFFHTAPLPVRAAALVGSLLVAILLAWAAEPFYDLPLRNWLSGITARRRSGLS